MENFNSYSLIFSFFVLFFVAIFMAIDKMKSFQDKKIKYLKKGKQGEAHGIIFGRKGNQLVYSAEDEEGHVGVFSASGTGKTSAIGIPTLRSWQGTSFTIDISGDICRNCPDMPHKLIYEPEDKETVPYNIFGAIDDLNGIEDRNEALEQLAFLLMPEAPNMNDNAKYFLTNGRKILTASLIAFYTAGMDFIAICEKIVISSYQELFRAIDETQNQNAIMYINSFLGASEQNTSGCKQSCDDSIKLFATNAKVKRSIRRPDTGEEAIEPKKIEKHNIFIVVGEDKLALYAPLMNIITSQMMQYIGTREVKQNSQTILLFLDEFGSLKLDADLILDGVRRFRKRKCRIMPLMQNTVDMNILYGEETTRAILSNLKYKVLLGGLGEPQSQKFFAELLGYKKIKKRSTSKSSKQTTRTESEERDWIIEPADLDRQGKDTLILLHPESTGYMLLRKNYYFKH